MNYRLNSAILWLALATFVLPIRPVWAGSLPDGLEIQGSLAGLKLIEGNHYPYHQPRFQCLSCRFTARFGQLQTKNGKQFYAVASVNLTDATNNPDTPDYFYDNSGVVGRASLRVDYDIATDVAVFQFKTMPLLWADWEETLFDFSLVFIRMENFSRLEPGAEHQLLADQADRRETGIFPLVKNVPVTVRMLRYR